MFISWLQLSASCHYLIDSTPDTMIQPFWRYISTSNNKCPSLLSLLPVPYYNCVSVPHLLTMSTMPNNIVYYSCLICESASRGLLRDCENFAKGSFAALHATHTLLPTCPHQPDWCCRRTCPQLPVGWLASVFDFRDNWNLNSMHWKVFE